MAEMAKNYLNGKENRGMYKITAYSFWIVPQEFWAESKEEADEVAKELKEQQYSVDVEEIYEGDE